MLGCLRRVPNGSSFHPPMTTKTTSKLLPVSTVHQAPALGRPCFLLLGTLPRPHKTHPEVRCGPCLWQRDLDQVTHRHHPVPVEADFPSDHCSASISPTRAENWDMGEANRSEVASPTVPHVGPPSGATASSQLHLCSHLTTGSQAKCSDWPAVPRLPLASSLHCDLRPSPWSPGSAT